MRETLYGRNAARECLRARRRHIHKLLLADMVEPAAIIDEIVTLAGRAKTPVRDSLPLQRMTHNRSAIVKAFVNRPPPAEIRLRVIF